MPFVSPLVTTGGTPGGTSAHSSGKYRRTFTDFRSLERALLFDDCLAARDAFTRLIEDSPLLAETFSRNPFPQDSTRVRSFKELGRSLQNGDLHGAKRAYELFQKEAR
jgi:hypothetical protein